MSFKILKKVLLSLLSLLIIISSTSPSLSDSIILATAPFSHLATSIRAGVIKILLAENPKEPLKSLYSLKFNDPKNFNQDTKSNFEVFHPLGGGLSFFEIPLEFMTDNKTGKAHFNDNFKIEGIESDKAELLVFVPNIKKESCEQLLADNKRAETGKKSKNRPAVPKLLSDQSALYNQAKFMDGESNTPSQNPVYLDHPDLLRSAYSCFLSNDGQTYVFYSAIIGM